MTSNVTTIKRQRVKIDTCGNHSTLNHLSILLNSRIVQASQPAVGEQSAAERSGGRTK